VGSEQGGGRYGMNPELALLVAAVLVLVAYAIDRRST
jgi:hypothetical protein